MKIAIDCRSFRKKPAGVSNFLIGVINHWAQTQKGWTLYLLANEEFSAEVKNKLDLSLRNIVVVVSPLSFFPGVAILWYCLRLPKLIRKLGVNLFYSPIPSLPPFLPDRVTTMVTVHDMVYKLFPDTMSRPNRIVNFFFHDKAIRRADKLWAISNYTKNEIDRFFPTRKSSRILVGTAVESSRYQLPVSTEGMHYFFQKFEISQPFILTVGTIEPRKNLEFLLRLESQLKLRNFQIVIVGATGWGNVHLPPGGDSSIIKWLGFVSHEQLIHLYSSAALYISVSTNEGFCMPLLEAMHCKCPVLAAHNSAMIELVEGAGETVKGWNPDDWLQAITTVVANRDYYIARGQLKAQKYDWRRVIQDATEYVMS